MNRDNTLGFDQTMFNILDGTFKAALLLGGTHTPEQIKLMMVATHLESLANLFLLADETSDKGGDTALDLKKVALGLMGTADWVKDGMDYGV